jgi:hypothetical protein
MLSLPLAKQLKQAGLSWSPSKNDFFVVPDRGLDDIVFVISDMTVMLEMISGQLAMTFHGAVEWALDYVMVTELVWLPTERQLRQALEQRLLGQSQPTVVLLSTADGYCCEIQFEDKTLSFEAFGAGDAYGLALLHVLEHQQATA